MTTKITEADARVLAARVGVTLDAEAARNAAIAMDAPLATADGHARTLGFEVEPATFLAVRQRCQR
ncbi:MAG: hypothetical protein HYR63_08420 [Proteobacteria bacterium]|nr:hypothetical protein [Pseudomonadota bacterium]MBI3497693.1 hypothetical protein [Pseudomonadota bacterium]